MDENVRFGYSPLDIEQFAEFSAPEEQLLQGSNGRVFYKRPDGHIVTFKDSDMTESEVSQMIQRVGLRKEDYFRADPPSTTVTGNVVYSNINLGINVKLLLANEESVNQAYTLTSTAITGYIDTAIFIPKGDSNLGIINYIRDISPINSQYQFIVTNLTTSEEVTVFTGNIYSAEPFALKEFIKNTLGEDRYEEWKNVRCSIIPSRILLNHDVISDTLINTKEKNWNNDLHVNSFDVIIRDTNITYGAPVDTKLTRKFYLTKDEYSAIETPIGTSAPNSFDVPFEDIPEADRTPGYYITLDGIYFVDEDGTVTLIASKSPPSAPNMSYIEPMIFRSNESGTGMYYDPDKLEAFLFGKDTPIYPIRNPHINISPFATSLLKGTSTDLYFILNNVRMISDYNFVGLEIAPGQTLMSNTNIVKTDTSAVLNIDPNETATEVILQLTNPFINPNTVSYITYPILDIIRPMIKLTPQLYEVKQGETINVSIEIYGFDPTITVSASDLTYEAFGAISSNTIFSVKNRDNFIFAIGTDEPEGNLITIKVKAPLLSDEDDAVGICEILVNKQSI